MLLPCAFVVVAVVVVVTIVVMIVVVTSSPGAVQPRLAAGRQQGAEADEDREEAGAPGLRDGKEVERGRRLQPTKLSGVLPQDWRRRRRTDGHTANLVGVQVSFHQTLSSM